MRLIACKNSAKNISFTVGLVFGECYPHLLIANCLQFVVGIITSTTTCLVYAPRGNGINFVRPNN